MSIKVEPKQKCHVCNLELDDNDLIVHFETKHSMKNDQEYKEQNHTNYMCDICDKFFKTPNFLTQHYEKVHGLKSRSRLKYMCDICDNLFKAPRHLKHHLKVQGV